MWEQLLEKRISRIFVCVCEGELGRVSAGCRFLYIQLSTLSTYLLKTHYTHYNLVFLFTKRKSHHTSKQQRARETLPLIAFFFLFPLQGFFPPFYKRNPSNR